MRHPEPGRSNRRSTAGAKKAGRNLQKSHKGDDSSLRRRDTGTHWGGGKWHAIPMHQFPSFLGHRWAGNSLPVLYLVSIKVQLEFASKYNGELNSVFSFDCTVFSWDTIRKKLPSSWLKKTALNSLQVLKQIKDFSKWRICLKSEDIFYHAFQNKMEINIHKEFSSPIKLSKIWKKIKDSK